MQITKRSLVTGITLGIIISGLNYISLFYFPWENGYSVASEQRIGYIHAKSNREACQLPGLSDAYKEGCLAFLRK